jgi:asparagine synthase (glutamine-hydrolysing)
VCGIAGIVSFTEDLADRQDLAEGMFDELYYRGPGEGGRWLSSAALLVFTRLAVIDLVGGQQPMVAEDGTGRTTAVLDYTGEVFNFAELRSELSARGHRFTTRSDTEVVLRAYQEWGVECAGHLRGMFAFAVWDAVREELVLIRDRLGIYPLFYSETPRGFVFGSEPKALFRSGLVSPVVDRDGLCEVLGFTPTPGRSVFRDVREVVPGEVVRYSRDGLRRHRYWQLTASEHTDDLPTTVDTVRGLLEEIVDMQVVSDVPLCTMLSGGLDSSLVAALAKRRTAGSALRTYSLEHAYNLGNFHGDEVHDSPDAPYAIQMARFLGSDHSELLVATDDLLDEQEHRRVVATLDRPAAGLELYVSFRALAARIRRTSTVTLSGDGADELFGGYTWFHNRRYVEAAAFPWAGVSHGTEMLSGLIDRDLYRTIDLEGYQRQRYAEAVAEVSHLDSADRLERRMREITHLNLTRYLRVVLDRRDRMGQAGPVEGRVPICDHRLVEYVYNVPWSMKAVDGVPKSLLRAAVRDLLPPEVLHRRKSPFPTAMDPAYKAGLVKRLEAIGDAGGLLDTGRVAAVLADPSGGLRSGITRTSIEMALQLHHWVQDSSVVVEV